MAGDCHEPADRQTMWPLSGLTLLPYFTGQRDHLPVLVAIAISLLLSRPGLL